MKYIISLFLILNQILLLGQKDIYNLHGTFWLNKSDEYVIFGEPEKKETKVHFINFMDDDDTEFRMIHDTIVFRSIPEYLISEDTLSYAAKLTVGEITDTTLILILELPSDEKLHQKKAIRLYNSIANHNINQFGLKRISINSAGQTIIIDSVGNIQVTKRFPNDVPLRFINESEFGYYTGKLSKSQLWDIKFSLFRIGLLDGPDLDNFEFNSHYYEEKLKIEYNDSELIYKYNKPKAILLPFLIEIYKYCDIKKLNKVE